ncbi:putative exo-1,4-beta-xylosidase bxlB [Tetrabaena socialis]|uniref:Putative exo-1,4-beta-xylosidase bxlB n=1 Tax=Tetrabaena socialis TaxID=47790 RepID=A0A2J8AI46_9CHLO|nr:putative exo-1,4-beta-xylosidase bxlB [Tetrabaena socialis]|eukprot:PNH12180.1 putative exo-1,4-beta-xylosidase bxlB [Tetrabaena socialis]
MAAWTRVRQLRAGRGDLDESYLPAFRACVAEGGAHSVMCAYNRVNGVPACANSQLLQQRLGQEWGFDSQPASFVVSDCGAVTDIWAAHHYNRTEQEAAAEALLRGTHLFCDAQQQPSLLQAINQPPYNRHLVGGRPLRQQVQQVRHGARQQLRHAELAAGRPLAQAGGGANPAAAAAGGGSLLRLPERPAEEAHAAWQLLMVVVLLLLLMGSPCGSSSSEASSMRDDAALLLLLLLLRVRRVLLVLLQRGQGPAGMAPAQ